MTLLIGLALYVLAFALVRFGLPDFPGGRRARRILSPLAPLAIVALLAVLFVGVTGGSFVAHAQDAVAVTDPSVPAGSISDASPSSVPGSAFDYGLIAVIVLIVIESAKRLASAIPGKRADEFEGYLGTAELLVRKLVDFLAGRSKNPEDQSAIKPD